MPRKGRGGTRQGRPGVAYTNRTDLNQPVRTAPSQGYGQRAAQERAQQAIPLPQMPPPEMEPLPAFNRPSERPNEPVTAGVPIGPGPDQSDFPIDPTAEVIRAALGRFRTPELARLLERLQ